MSVLQCPEYIQMWRIEALYVCLLVVISTLEREGYIRGSFLIGVTHLSLCRLMSSIDGVRVGIVDDHSVLRTGLRCLLDSEPDLEVVAEAATLSEARSMIAEKEGEVDVIVLDLSLPDGSGLELLKDIRARALGTSVLVLTRHDEELFGLRTLQAGARGFLHKGVDPSQVVDAIHRIQEGHVVVSENLEVRVLQGVSRGLEQEDHPLSSLSDRELEVFEQVGLGRSNSEISSSLHLTRSTVQTYRTRIQRKLGLASSSELIRAATQFAEGWPLEKR